MCDHHSKLPRLYLDQDLFPDAPLTLDAGPAHYFRTVLRRQAGDSFRVFNGRDGEFLAELSSLGKKNGEALVKDLVKSQPPAPTEKHLLFTAIKKQRLDFLIEKAVELGVTDLHPVLTRHTEVRKINEERIRAQIIEALEQCERLFLPRLHPLEDMKAKLQSWDGPAPVNACIERHSAAGPAAEAQAFLTGPEGGFDEEEVRFLLDHEKIRPVSLGETVYRAETAALICLAATHEFS